ncbi:MAG: site-specific DNA-methyltransferase [Sulfuricaulis sp.]|nr:site-specific DNA-methyltransferase [Sulfuricaulis sp.]
MSVRILHGDCRDVLKTLPDASVQCCVTSPPYWGGLRDYGHDGQLGMEREPAEYVGTMVDVFRDVRRVLLPTGTLWLNVGDVYAASGKGGGGNRGDRKAWETVAGRNGFRMPPPGFKMKDLTLVAFALADALRRDGWYLRSTIIWRKPSAVEPTRLDRPAVSHEYLFLLSVAERYYARPPAEVWWSHSVWDIRSDSDGNHPAAMPAELARRCLIVGCPEGGTALDPFHGYGTVGMVADRLQRSCIGIELNPTYADMASRRITGDAPLFAEVACSATAIGRERSASGSTPAPCSIAPTNRAGQWT